MPELWAYCTPCGRWFYCSILERHDTARYPCPVCTQFAVEYSSAPPARSLRAQAG